MTKKKKIVLTVILSLFLVIGIVGLVCSIRLFNTHLEAYHYFLGRQYPAEYMKIYKDNVVFSLVNIFIVVLFLIENIYFLIRMNIFVLIKNAWNYKYEEFKNEKQESKLLKKKQNIEKLKKELEEDNN